MSDALGPSTALLTDHYELTMLQATLASGTAERRCVFELFGRRLPENGAAGVDHGYGSAVLVAGGGVRGGRYHSRWPTLRDGRLESGDLTVTTDYRHLLMEILQARFPGVDAHRVFPQAGYRRRLGVMR